MKRIKTTQLSPGGWCAGLFILLVACTSGEQETGIGRPLVVTAEIAPPLTRANAHDSDYDKQSFVANDQINIYSGSVASGAPTVYTYKTSSGSSNLQWLPDAGGDGIVITSEDGTYTASYPTTFSGILEDQTTKTNFWSSNQLLSTATAEGNRVDFSFAQAAAKITINVEYATATTGTSITLTGKNLRTEGGSGETIKLLPVTATGNKHTYIGIVHASSNANQANYTITVVTAADANGKSYTQADITLEAANNYIYNFTSTNKLILNGVQVAPFASDGNAISGGDINAT